MIWIFTQSIKKRNWQFAPALLDIIKHNQLFDEFCLDREKFYVSYSGNIGLTQNMELLIQAAVQLQNIDDIGFIVIGDGAYKEELQRQIIEKNLKNITLIPFQPYTRISEVFSVGDVGLIINITKK